MADNEQRSDHTHPGGNKVAALAEEFVERLRRGEYPSISEYVERFPELAAEIREVLPALATLEKYGADDSPQVPPLADNLSPVPQQLGEYRVIREIGRGGMGIVYEAVHATMRRRVALKVLPASATANPRQLQRFLRETRAAGRLHHTNIVPVFEVGMDHGIYFYAMQFIHGQSLDVVFEELRRLQSAAPPTWPATSATFASRPSGISAASSAAWHLYSGQFERPDQLACDDTDENTVVRSDAELPPATGDAGIHAAAVLDHPANWPASPSGTPDGSFANISSSLTQSANSPENYFHRVARIGLQAAEALAYAHGQGVLHRDVKPSNLILDTTGVVWLTDFGLAKNEEEQMTRTGDLIGTLRYMAPERLQGQVDARGDVYGLGLTLYELCTLQVAFDQPDRAQLIQQLTQSEPVAPRKLRRHIPRDLETIILKAIDKHPGQRYKSAENMAHDLRLFLSDRPIQARRVTTTERLWRWCRRNPYPAVLSTVVAALMLIILVGSLWFAFDSRRKSYAMALQAQDLALKTTQAQRAARSARKSDMDSRLTLYDQYLTASRLERGAGHVGQRINSLNQIVKARDVLQTLDVPDDQRAARRGQLRDEAIACLAHCDMQRRNVRRFSKPWTDAVAFNAAVDRYAQSDDRGQIAIRRLSDHRELLRLPATGLQAWELQFSGDDQYLAARYHPVGRQAEPLVIIWDLPSQKPLIRLESDEVFNGDFDFSPDSGCVAIGLGVRRGVVRIYDLPDGTIRQSLPAEYRIQDVRFGPHGERLIVSQEFEPRADLWNLADESCIELHPPAPIYRFCWNQQLLGGAAADGNVYLWPSADMSSEPKVLEGHRREVVQLLLNQRGDRALSQAWDGTWRLWNTHSRNQMVLARRGSVASDRFSHNDRRVGFVDSDSREVGVLEFMDTGPLRSLGRGDKTLRYNVAFHPDHPQLIACGSAEGLELWDSAAARRIAFVPVDLVTSCLFTPDGAFLLSSGEAGLLRWPVKEQLDGSTWRLTVGPAETLINEAYGRISLDRDGRWLAVSNFQTGQTHIVDLQNADETYQLKQLHRRIAESQLSPDARWVVTCTWHGRGIWLWDRTTGERVDVLDDDGYRHRPAFSPDGTLLAISGDGEQCIWDVASRRPLHRFSVATIHPGGVAFSPDGQVLAMIADSHAIRLVTPESGRQLAVLELPEFGTIDRLVFDSSGTRLAVVADRQLHLWDLRSLREELVALDLDWDAPAYPRPDEELVSAREISVDVHR